MIYQLRMGIQLWQRWLHSLESTDTKRDRNFTWWLTSCCLRWASSRFSGTHMYFKSGDPFHLFWCLIQNLLRLDLQHQIERAGCQYALSPVAHMCWTDEDMIGRVSRLSRRCHPLTTTRRCLERALCNYRRQFGIHFSTSYLQKQGSWCDKIEDSYLKVVSRSLFNLEVLNIIVF